MMKISEKLDCIASFIIGKRYIIALVLFIILIVLKVNFSSVGEWNNYTNEIEHNNVLIGKSRAIRSDDWLVQTPMMISQTQGEDAYKIYNKNIEQGSLNMLMVSAPVKDIVILAKPLMWGFLIFGTEYGYSFYWVLKIILLFLVSIEIVLKITKKDNFLSLFGGIILSLAPAMMWWLSSAIVDGYIFGMATIILFSYYMNNLNCKLWKKILMAIGLFITVPAFAVTLYPAFQVPFAFLMFVFMINDFITNVKKLKKKDYLIIFITICAITGLLARYFMLCIDDMKTLMNTVYPGNRIAVGGELNIERFISYFANVFFPYSNNIANPCEPSSYIYPFIGLIVLLIYNIRNIKEEKKDSNFYLLWSLIGLYVIYFIWELIGFGEKLAKITFLYLSPAPRTHVIFGIIGILLTIFMIKKYENKKIFTKMQSLAISICVIIFSIVLIKNTSYVSYITNIKLIAFIIMMFAITYFFILGNKKIWCCIMCAIAIISGLTVNPISIGLSPINETKISQEIQKIKNEDENSLWIGNNNITGQYVMANGANVLNGVNTYPNFKWLTLLDPERKYNDIYNRYAHISIKLGDKTEFVLLTDDSYLVNLTYEDLKKIGIKYYYTNEKLTDSILNQFSLEEKYSNYDNNQYIYKINY